MENRFGKSRMQGCRDALFQTRHSVIMVMSVFIIVSIITLAMLDNGTQGIDMMMMGYERYRQQHQSCQRHNRYVYLSSHVNDITYVCKDKHIVLQLGCKAMCLSQNGSYRLLIIA